MKTKLFELRDKMTFIPIIAISIEPETNKELYLVRRAGYAPNERYILLTRLDGGPCHYDPYDWNDRTFHNAHEFILNNWDALNSGDVIDVEFILGETKTIKISESEE